MKKTKANTAKSKKAKGVRLELKVADMIAKTLKVTAKKMPKSGQNKGFKSDIYTELPISIECKNQENWKIHEWWEQCTHDAVLNEEIPVLVMSKNNMKNPKVLLSFSNFLQLLRFAIKGGWITRKIK